MVEYRSNQISNECHKTRLKRLKIQSNRRGIKEMDLILGLFADTSLLELSDTQLDDFEALLGVNDTTLLDWFTKQTEVPEKFSVIFKLVEQSFISESA